MEASFVDARDAGGDPQLEQDVQEDQGRDCRRPQGAHETFPDEPSRRSGAVQQDAGGAERRLGEPVGGRAEGWCQGVWACGRRVHVHRGVVAEGEECGPRASEDQGLHRGAEGYQEEDTHYREICQG